MGVKCMEVEIMSTQTIRQAAAGASSTPAAAEKCFTLSIFDQLMPAVYVPILLFYSATDVQISAKSDILKKSLSETLTQFFPLAGRISENIRIADEGPAGTGIEYTEARVRGKLLSDILSPPNLEAIGKLLPAVKNSSSMEKLLAVQQSVFECGGMAIGICLSHKVVDAAAVSLFLGSWSANARCGGNSSDMAAAAPYLSSASRFPPSDAFATSTYTNYPEQENATRRFVFSGPQVASLKAKSCSRSVTHPTRVEAVVSLLWKCLMRSNSKMKNPSSSSLSCGGWQYVNLRSRVYPPLPDNTFGNLIGVYKVSTCAKNENGTHNDDLAGLVSQMRHAKKEYLRDNTKRLSQDSDPGTSLNEVCESYKQIGNDASKQNGDNYFFSCVCNVDLYGAGDFGWGKPIWATLYMKYTYSVILSDSREAGGIQVWLSLPKQQMDVFEKEPLLLTYATPNPSINEFDHHCTTRFIPFCSSHQCSVTRCLVEAHSVGYNNHHHHQTTNPNRRFDKVSSPLLLSRPNSLSHILGRSAAVPHHYSSRPLRNIHNSTNIALPPSIRFISSLLHLHGRKLIIR